MNRFLADQLVWHFEDNRSDIALVEEVPAMAKQRIAVIPMFVVEGILKITRCDSVGGEQIGSDSDEGANTRLAMDFARITFDQQLALVPADSLASGSTDLKLLNMDMLVPVHMSRFVEPELEDNVFASVTSQVQAEGIQTLNVKGIRCREDNIRIDGHRHHRCVGSALKQIEITHVQAWILFRKFGIEMMGHRSPLCQCVIDYSRLTLWGQPRRRGAPHGAPVAPPSTINSTALTYDESSEARKSTALAISSGSPQRPNGTADETKSASLVDCSSVTLARGPRFQMGVFVAPGATTFTRMLRGARSAAMARAMETRPPLVAAYAARPGWPR